MTDIALPRPENTPLLLSPVTTDGTFASVTLPHEPIPIEVLETAVTEVQADTTLETEAEQAGARSHIARLFSSAKHGAETAVALTVLMPSNEAIRAGIFAAGYSMSHSPLMGAATVGLSTFALESAGGLAAADLFNTGTSHRFQKWLKKREGDKDAEAIGISKYAKAVWTFLGGTVVGMAIEQKQDPERTIGQNRRYSIVTSAWLGGILAAGGAVGSEAVTEAIGNPTISGPILGSALAVEGGRHLAARMRRLKPADRATEMWRDSDKRFTYQLVTDETQLKEVAELEQAVWDENSFGNLIEEGYGPHIERSRTFAAFKGEKCVGMSRMFVADSDVVPPFLSEDMPFYDETEREALIKDAQAGLVEELGTAAVASEVRRSGVNARLWRMAYRDALARGVKQWGIIIEPERVEKDLNGRYGFTFRRLGNVVEDYQGGDCAAFVMDLDEVNRSMQRKHPLSHWWFMRKALKS